MEVEIKVTATEKELNQAQLHRLKRISNVLRENGFEVEITFTPLRIVKKTA